ncbi:MAG: hypothetical protein US11_C0001G0174 [Candidatus Roizmanbacteria bacterium GW2011_GWA2_36_23]|uniref:Serine aminopeptidase S33 domain-containing protein n=1 Tax=Candidatus Roizmanbacteria bacterium GW2011_GWA2_36_23 TaxID=1618480 RepID=A0A0G0EM60_9BACT|nr:MAG: hypothetical protein US11_C0001G0174 [Candidatus Roizmanbacteria bacterium GW2011_GWA2_36_23]
MKKNNTKSYLVEFKSIDNLLLPGLLFEPSAKTDKVALYLHGNGSASIFYSVSKINLLASELLKNNIAFFPFNNRGAHYIHKLNRISNSEEKDVKLGTAYELIKDCILDVDGAIDFLRTKGYEKFYLIGSSTGANKVVVYNYYKSNNAVSGYILLSGGDDTGLYYDMLGKKKFFSFLRKSRLMIEKGKGGELIPQYLGGGLISYQSLYDTINPDGDYNVFPFNEYFNKLRLSKKPLFKEYKSINKPTLVIYGGQDEYCYGNVQKCVEALKKVCPNPNLFTFKILKGADHGFHGKEKELSKIITGWLLGVNTE